MGLKFYRSSNKAKKIRHRLNYTRTWFSTHKWVSYFAHPNLVPGHPFKGGDHWQSTGQLLHPEAKKFGLTTPHLFKPTRPGTAPTDEAPKAAHNYANPDALLHAHLGKNNFTGEGNCGKFMSAFRKCFSSAATGNPDETCAYYVDGLRRSC